jgi:hypothetical protein
MQLRDGMKVPCQNLQPDGKCGIFQQWAERGECTGVEIAAEDGLDDFGDVLIARIRTIGIRKALAEGRVEPEIAAQCCYAHPELLDQYEPQ